MCQSDADCEVGRFCNRKGSFLYCEKCGDCARQYKREPARDNCAKTADECGRCLPGFAAEALTDGHPDGAEKEICQPVTTPQHAAAAEAEGNDIWPTGVVTILGVVVAVVIAGMAILCILRRPSSCRKSPVAGEERSRRVRFSGRTDESRVTIGKCPLSLAGPNSDPFQFENLFLSFIRRCRNRYPGRN